MSEFKAVAQNTIIQIIGKAISTGLGLFAISLMARNLGVEKFGWYITVTGFLQFVGIFSDFGFTVITATMLSEPTFDKQKLLNNLFTWRFITAFLFHALAPVIFLFLPYPSPVKVAAFIATLSFFFIALNNVFIGYYQAKLKMITQIAGEVIGRVMLIVGLLLVSIRNYDFLTTMAVITLASGAYTFYLLLKSPKIQFQIDSVISKAIFHKLWPIALSVIFNVFYLQGDRVLLPLYASQTDVGLYGAAYRVLDIATQSAAMIMGIMAPLVTFAWSRGLIDEFKKRYQASFDLVLLLLIPMMTGIFVLSDQIMRVIGGVEFIQAGGILRLLSIAITGLAIGNIFGYLVLTINKQKTSLWIYLITAIITVVAYLYFIPRYGIYGAAWTSIFSEVFAGICLMILCRYYSKVKISFWPAIKILAASMLMGWLVAKIQPLHLGLSIFIGVASYGILIIAFRVLPKDAIKEMFKATPSQPASQLPPAV